ncbi:MAG: hypothetical protein OQL19_17785 [Gammaproteobacteria bacterium]|nr:hypothetical protein [Gammaproteobacteria bacterium]
MSVLVFPIDNVFITIGLYLVIQCINLDEITLCQVIAGIIVDIGDAATITAGHLTQTSGIFVIGKINILSTELSIGQTDLNSGQSMGIGIHTGF